MPLLWKGNKTEHLTDQNKGREMECETCESAHCGPACKLFQQKPDAKRPLDRLLTAVIGCESGRITVRTREGWLLWSNDKIFGLTIGDMMAESLRNLDSLSKAKGS